MQRITLFLLRIALGWLFFYSGISKLMADSWSAAFYLKDAKMFPELFNLLLQPTVLPVVNMLNVWGQILIGLALILGLGVRLASFAGALLMVLYYLPILDFPYPNAHSFIVDEHVVYALAFLVLAAFGAGRFWGLQRLLINHPRLYKILC